MARVIPGTRSTPVRDEYRRENRIGQLTFGPHDLNVATSSQPWTAPTTFETVHSERLAATGLYKKTAISIGEKPVPLPTPIGNGQLYRPPQGIAAWRVREAFNAPFMFPGKAFSPQDIHDFQVVRRSPTLAAAVAELEANVPNINGVDPAEAGLSPLATTLLLMVQLVEKRSPFGHLLGGSTANLMETGAVQDALMQFAISISRDNVFTAADIEDLGTSGTLLVKALNEAVPAQRGLQAVLHRAHFPIEPVGPDVPLTREEADAIRQVDPSLLDTLVEQAPIPKTLPELEAAKAQLSDDAFAGTHVVAVQHLLATNVTMFDAMIAKGLNAKEAEIIGVPYSTNFVCEHALRQRGFTVNTPDVVDPSQVTQAYEDAIGPAIERALKKSIADGKPVLLMDDGGKLSTYVAKHYPEHAHRFHVVEQTTRGLTELSKLPEVPMAVVDVAKSPLKQLEMPFIGQQVVKAAEDLVSQIGMGGATLRPAVVMGYGPIGESIARALAAQGTPVTIWDPDPEARQRARDDGFDVPEDRETALRDKGLAIGGSGHRSITREDLELLGHEAVVASASSRDIEIDLTANHDETVEVVPLLASGRGDSRFTTRVWRFEDRDVVVLRNGFPLNFDGDFETGTAEAIAATRAAMLLGAAQALKETKPGIHAADVEPQRKVAEAVGKQLPEL